jgi:hypothetical protein
LQVLRADAAKRLNVSVRSVAAAKVVQTRTDPAIARRVDRGEVTVALAAKLATMPAAAQAMVADLPERELRLATQRLARAAREEALADRTEAASVAIGSSSTR